MEDYKEQVNENLNNLMKYLSENLKAQNEENKNMFEKMFKDKEDSLKNDKELLHNIKEINAKNNELVLNNNILNNKIKTLEEQITKLNLYKDIVHNAKGFKCKHCEKIYLYENFKDHYTGCKKGIIISNTNINNNGNFNPEKLRIKILKGKVKQDELGKPFLEYIIDVNYDTQNWRLNKRFNQFSNLYKTLKNLYKGTGIQMPGYINKKKIIELSKIEKFKSEESINLIKQFSENDFDISNINPNEFIQFILNEMNEEINSDKNENYFEKINPKDTNEIKKKNFEMNYKQYIEKNKTLISDNFLVISIKTKKCKNCPKDKNKYFNFIFFNN